MNKTNLLWGLIALLTLGACQDDTLKDDSSTNGVNGKTFIELNIEEGTSSRLMYEGFSTKFVEGDKIGVYAENFENLPFTVTGELRRAYSDKPVIMEKGTEFFTYYPYNEAITDATAVPVSIATRQDRKSVV